MIVQIVKTWGLGSIGRYEDVQPNVAATLIRRGVAVASDAPPKAAPKPAAAKPFRKAVKPK